MKKIKIIICVLLAFSLSSCQSKKQDKMLTLLDEKKYSEAEEYYIKHKAEYAKNHSKKEIKYIENRLNYEDAKSRIFSTGDYYLARDELNDLISNGYAPAKKLMKELDAHYDQYEKINGILDGEIDYESLIYKNRKKKAKNPNFTGALNGYDIYSNVVWYLSEAEKEVQKGKTDGLFFSNVFSEKPKSVKEGKKWIGDLKKYFSEKKNHKAADSVLRLIYCDSGKFVYEKDGGKAYDGRTMIIDFYDVENFRKHFHCRGDILASAFVVLWDECGADIECLPEKKWDLHLQIQFYSGVDKAKKYYSLIKNKKIRKKYIS